MFFDAYPLIFARAKFLRNNMTVAELKLWEQLRNNKMGFRFKAQHPMIYYIADFYCFPLRLVIEIDGPIHDFQKEKDAIRSQTIENAGNKVIRFTNEEVMNHLDDVVKRIKEVVEQLKPSVIKPV